MPICKVIYWRNSKLDFTNPEKLISSLELRPKNSCLIRTQDSLDENVLRQLLKRGENNIIYYKNLELLWECCQIPDFEKKAYGQHLNIVDKVFKFLSTKKRKIPNDYMKEQLKGLEKDHGNIDVLSHRISNVRTWAYVANKKNWVENSDYWIQITKSIEDKLSDKLHEELTRSFIDKKISLLSKSLKQDLILDTDINENNQIIIDNQVIGELKGLKFNIKLTSQTLDTDVKSIKKATRRSVEKELYKRVNEIIKEKEVSLEANNNIVWKGNPIARLKKGHDYLNPRIHILADDSLEDGAKLKLDGFLKIWMQEQINDVLDDLINLTKEKIKNQYLRALLFQLFEKNGVLKRSDVNDLIKKLAEDERKKLWRMGVKIGRYHIYLPKMFKPKAVSFRISLWKLFNNISSNNEIPKFGLNFLENEKKDKNFLLLCGFEKFKEFFVRIDILEKLFLKIIEKTKDKKFEVDSSMMNLLGCSKENFYKLMTNMNYKKDKNDQIYRFIGDKRNKINKMTIKENPFSKLQSIKFN